jgi:Ca2+-dependent lipid-binding protein
MIYGWFQKDSKIELFPHIRLKVCEARDLVALGMIGESDPFIEIFFQDQTSTTKVMKNTLNPVWNETFDFEVKETVRIIYMLNKSGMIKFKLVDWDLINPNELIGELDYNIKFLEIGWNKNIWLDLPKGTLKIEIEAIGFGTK